MPWCPGVSARLTDDQLWAIVCADPSITNRQLAETLGAHGNTVTHARRRLRRHGWTCSVSYTTCRHCGAAVTRQGNGQERRTYHPACRPVAVQQTLHGVYRRRDRLRSRGLLP